MFKNYEQVGEEKYKFDYDTEFREFSEEKINKIVKKINIEEYDDNKILTQEEAIEDVYDFFYLLSNIYGLYEYFGGDLAFSKAKEEILTEIQSKEEIMAVELMEIIKSNISFINDKHFSIYGDRENYENNIVEEIKNEVVGNFDKRIFINDNYIFLKDEKGYFLLEENFLSKFGKKSYVENINNDFDVDNYFYTSLDKNSNLVYKLGGLFHNNTEEVFYNVNFEKKSKNIKLNKSITNNDRVDLSGEKESTFEIDTNKKIITITYPSFKYNVIRSFNDTLAEVNDNEYIIIDLRGNYGGRFDNYWIEKYIFNETKQKKPEVKENLTMKMYDDGYSKWTYTYINNFENLIEHSKKIFILTDANTGSASEHLIYEFKKLENTVIIGSNTLGAISTNADNSSKLSNSNIFFKRGNNIFISNMQFDEESVGIIPDILLGDTNDALELTLKFIENYESIK